MLKKVFGSTVITALLLSLVFAGCSDPLSQYEYKDIIPVIEGPGNVRAVAYSGLIQVSWDPAPDASSYDVYRRAVKNAAGEEPANYESVAVYDINGDPIKAGSSLTITDIVSYSNQLQNDWEYEYTVVAINTQSPYSRTVSKDDVILNAKAVSNRVRAIIPERGSKLADPEVDEVAYDTKLWNTHDKPGEYMILSWKKVPGANYQVLYTFNAYTDDAVDGAAKLGTVTLSYNDDAANDTSNLLGNNEPYGYWRVPLLDSSSVDRGDGVDLKVKAFFKTDYYRPSDAVIAEFPERTIPSEDDPFAGSRVSGLAVDFVNDSDSSSLADYRYKAEITWNDLVNAATYTVYKVRVDSASKVLGEWTALTGTPEAYYSTAPIVKKWRLSDNTALVEGEFYQYFIVAANAAGIKTAAPTASDPLHLISKDVPYHPSRDDIEVFRTKDPALLAFTYDIQNVVYAATPNNRIRLEWEYEKDVTYRIYRTTATFEPLADENLFSIDPETGNLTAIGTWTELEASVNNEINYSIATSVDPATGMVTGTAHAFDNNLALRQSYLYKIVASKTFGTTVVETEPAYVWLTATPFNQISQLSVIAAEMVKASDPLGQIKVTVTSPSADLSDLGSVVKLYRRITDTVAGPEVQYESTPVKTFTGAEIDATGGAVWVQTGAVNGKTYSYKAILESNGVEFLNSSPSNYTTATPPTPVVTSGLSSFSLVPLPAGLATTAVGIRILDSNTSNHNLHGVSLEIRYRNTTAAVGDYTGTDATNWKALPASSFTVEPDPSDADIPLGLIYNLPRAGVSALSLPALTAGQSYYVELRISGDDSTTPPAATVYINP
jgi:hypothetical protein